MPSFDRASPDSNNTYWSGIAGILAIHLAVLFAVSVAALAYLNWSSNAALAEFMAKDKLQIRPHEKNPNLWWVSSHGYDVAYITRPGNAYLVWTTGRAIPAQTDF